MNRKRDGACILVVDGYKRISAWRVEALANASGNRPKEKLTGKSTHETHAYRHERPRDKRKRDDPLAREAVADEPRNDRHSRKRPRERRVYPSNLDIGKTDVLLYRNR